jgi:2Fe-2S ferredoxin
MGAQFEASPGTTLCDTLLAHGIEIAHACEKSCACATCRVIVRAGFDSLESSSPSENHLLANARRAEPHSRLSCQAKVARTNLVVELP